MNRRTRSEFSKKTKLQAWDRSGGLCEVVMDGQRCGAMLRPGQFDYHHNLETVEGGENSLENCVCACKICHQVITSARAPILAKSRRIEEKHLGLRKAKSRPMPGTKASGWKKRFDGTAERR